MAQVRMALIGCGGMGRSEAKLVPQIPGARLVACCDVSPEAARRAAQELQVPAFTDPAEVLHSPEVDAVIVATPNGLHTDLVCDAAAAGKHIFCEKPMAFTVVECDRMIAAAERHGVRLMVGHVLRLLPLFQRIADVLDGGALGRPVSVDITRIAALGNPSALYRLRRELCGGLLYDVTVHEIDLLHRLCGPVQSVYALADNYTQPAIDYEDTVHLLMRHEGGAQSHILAALSSRVAQSTGIVIAEHGTLRYNWSSGEIDFQGEGQDAVRETVSGGGNGYLRELRSFVRWVSDGTEPLLTWREGRAAIAVVEAAYRSAVERVPVRPG